MSKLSLLSKVNLLFQKKAAFFAEKMAEAAKVNEENQIVDKIKNLCLQEGIERHKETIQKAKEEYSQAHRDLVNKLSVDHLNAYIEILEEHGKVRIKNPEDVIESLKEKLFQRLEAVQVLNDPSVENAVIELEVCKEKCEQFQGTDWNEKLSSPNERLLPLRVHYKQKRLDYLRNQLEKQNAKLEQVLQQNAVHRSRITEISRKRAFVQEKMIGFSKTVEANKERLLSMQQEILNRY